tara:strand:+ start:9884 stop:11938 length:2055 start_codon:yes stop_codon:yes gene_type:complete
MENKQINNLRVLAIVQARMSSVRLPGKVLKKIGDTPLISLLVNRLSKSLLTDKIIIACTDNAKDDALVEYLDYQKIDYFRGHEKDVLKRFYDCANQFSPEYVIRITADCPFIDASIVDACIEEIFENDHDYVSNTGIRSYPDGLDVAVFKFSVLEDAYKNCKEPFGREHVTPYMKESDHVQKFNIQNESDFSKIRITVDEAADLQVIRSIYNHLGTDDFSWKEIIDLKKKKPEIFSENAITKRNEGSRMTDTQKLWKRAKTIIPGGNHLLSKRPEQFAPNIWPAYYSKAKGCEIWDLENNKYKDMSIMGIGTNILGYSNEEIDREVIKSLQNGNMSTLNCPEEVYLAERLLEINEWAGMVRFARTGGEANAIAIRIARAASSRSKVAICGYHGWHDWYLSANLQSEKNLGNHHLKGFYTAGVPKELEGTALTFKYNNFHELEKIVSENDIGIIKMEVMRNEEPKDNFLQKVRKLATEKNIVLIFDECTSGFRETFGGLYKKYDVQPDMAMFGKAMGNGYAITGVVGKKEIMDHVQDTFISSTFWTERAGPTAALKTLEVMERERSWEYISELGKYIKDSWKDIAKRNELDIDIFGLSSITKYTLKTKNDFIKYKTLIAQEMLKRGFLATNSVYVSLAHDKKLVDEYIDSLNEVFGMISKCEDTDLDINELLDDEVCHVDFTRLN